MKHQINQNTGRYQLSPSAHSQRGVALAVGLIMLIMVSLLAAGSFMLTTSEARGAAGWSDRQRALFAAEGALKEGENVAQDLVDKIQAKTIESAVRLRLGGLCEGFYVRRVGDMPDVDPWPEAKSCRATSKGEVDNVFYMVVFEGLGFKPGFGQVETATGGAKNQSALQPRFTIYAKAGGIKEGTYVVLSSSRAF